MKKSTSGASSATTSSRLLQLAVTVLWSLLPFVSFLCIYGLNNKLHFLWSLKDLSCVHTDTITRAEAALLSFQPHALFSANPHPVLDVLSAIPYLLHYPLPILIPCYLIAKGCSEDVPRFYWLLGWTMWSLYFIWMVFPHIPPWVTDSLRTNTNVTATLEDILHHREGCAFARIDQRYHMTFFHNLFDGNPVPYASFPSGHVAWPTCAWLVDSGRGSNFFLIYIVYMTWATLYSCHHYLSDAIAGFLVAYGVQRLLNMLEERGMCTYQCKSKASVHLPCGLHHV